MSNTRSHALRPLVSLRALVVVALVLVLSPGVAMAKRKPSIPRPAAVEVTRTAAALRYLDPLIADATADLRRIERRRAAVAEDLERIRVAQRVAHAALQASTAERALAAVGAYAEGDVTLAGALTDMETVPTRALVREGAAGEQPAEVAADVRDLTAEHVALDAEEARLLELRATLERDRAYARDLAAEGRRMRAFVLADLSMPLRQRAVRAAQRLIAADRRAAPTIAETVPDVRVAADAADVAPVAASATAPERGSGVAAVAAAYALTMIGTPYRAGGESPTGFDCSGLIYWSYGRAGVTPPRSSYDLWSAGRRIPLREAQPGDIVSFHDQGHTGFYLGGGLYVHSTRSGDVVRVSSVHERRDLDGVVRLEGLDR